MHHRAFPGLPCHLNFDFHPFHTATSRVPYSRLIILVTATWKSPQFCPALCAAAVDVPKRCPRRRHTHNSSHSTSPSVGLAPNGALAGPWLGDLLSQTLSLIRANQASVVAAVDIKENHGKTTASSKGGMGKGWGCGLVPFPPMTIAIHHYLFIY